MNVQKIDFRSISPPPHNFNMQVIQQELRRLAQGQTEVEEQLREQKSKSAAVEELFTYKHHSVQRHEVDPSALFDESPTLSHRLAALEDITKRLEQDDLASRQVMERLQTSVFFTQEETTLSNARMARLEEIQQELWRGSQDRLNVHQTELGSIREEHQRFEAEMKETVTALESKCQVTPAALEERLTEAIGKLKTRVDDVEQSVMMVLTTVHKISEQHLQLSGRQSTLEQIIIQHLGKKVRADVGIDATEIGDIGTTKTKVEIGINSHASLDRSQATGQVQSNSPAPILLVPNPVVATRARSASPYPIGSRKSPRLQELAVPPSSKSCPTCVTIHTSKTGRYYRRFSLTDAFNIFVICNYFVS
jgi:hypothetical protein